MIQTETIDFSIDMDTLIQSVQDIVDAKPDESWNSNRRGLEVR